MSSLSAACTFSFSFFNYPPTTEIYTLSLHDALPICPSNTSSSTYRLPTWTTSISTGRPSVKCTRRRATVRPAGRRAAARSEEHTSELQSLTNLVCRLLLEKKNKRAPEDSCLRRRTHR